jgi:hypothetical protein
MENRINGEEKRFWKGEKGKVGHRFSCSVTVISFLFFFAGLFSMAKSSVWENKKTSFWAEKTLLPAGNEQFEIARGFHAGRAFFRGFSSGMDVAAASAAPYFSFVPFEN